MFFYVCVIANHSKQAWRCEVSARHANIYMNVDASMRRSQKRLWPTWMIPLSTATITKKERHALAQKPYCLWGGVPSNQVYKAGARGGIKYADTGCCLQQMQALLYYGVDHTYPD